MYFDEVEDKVLLTESVKRNIRKSEQVEIFEIFFF